MVGFECDHLFVYTDEEKIHDSFESNIVASVNNAFFLPLVLSVGFLQDSFVLKYFDPCWKAQKKYVKETTGNSAFGHCELLVSGKNDMCSCLKFKAFKQKIVKVNE